MIIKMTEQLTEIQTEKDKRILPLFVKKQIDFGTHKLGQAYIVNFMGKTDE